MKREMVSMSDVIQEGIEKLESYMEQISDIPAYTLAMIINPNIKLRWHQQHAQDCVGAIKEMFITELRRYRSAGSVATPRRPVLSDTQDDLDANTILGLDITISKPQICNR
ncbi:hypothetical protein K435DRAFT_211908 [Dendrothele bispora CBS 962.96]|uniref:hAT-like transposase RNase-H fold domain-containing protein n=1 Tax=Dendrothele bispora (strain CBS 962.96) TaxID=1314807 RepID=A0A4S8MMN1_DENBC|nr:hypothetical protein K435DRAFT_211908 [Dendrothele bispora CBS 962.96]